MMTLKDAIAQYGSSTTLPAVGDRVLFERGEDSGSFSLNLGEVKEVKEGGEFTETMVTVRGIHTFYPDGRSKRFRGLTPYRFPANHFLKPIGERLLVHAKRWEDLAAEARRWEASWNDSRG